MPPLLHLLHLLLQVILEAFTRELFNISQLLLELLLLFIQLLSTLGLILEVHLRTPFFFQAAFSP